jgi:hypothetical protein
MRISSHRAPLKIAAKQNQRNSLGGSCSRRSPAKLLLLAASHHPLIDFLAALVTKKIQTAASSSRGDEKEGEKFKSIKKLLMLFLCLVFR